MSKTCPKCGADGNGKPAPKESRYWCSSSAWENGDFYQSPECVRRERDNLKERVAAYKAVAEDPAALWANWLRGTVKLPAGIGDVRQMDERVKRLERAISLALSNCYDGPMPDYVRDALLKAKETKL